MIFTVNDQTTSFEIGDFLSYNIFRMEPVNGLTTEYGWWATRINTELKIDHRLQNPPLVKGI